MAAILSWRAGTPNATRERSNVNLDRLADLLAMDLATAADSLARGLVDGGMCNCVCAIGFDLAFFFFRFFCVVLMHANQQNENLKFCIGQKKKKLTENSKIEINRTIDLFRQRRS